MSGEIRTAGGDQDDDAGADFVEQVGTDGEDIAGGPEVDAALVVGGADGGGRQGGARAGNLVVVLLPLIADEGGMPIGEILIDAAFHDVVHFGSVEGRAVVARGGVGRSEIGQREELLREFESLRTNVLRQENIAGKRRYRREGVL